MTTISLTAKDDHRFSAYEAVPSGPARGGIVIVQEIFGVNQHIRDVADGYAEDGYRVLAPAIFDRVARGVELGYGQDGRTRGIALRQEISLDEMLRDIEACVAALTPAGKVAVVGYCLGGSLAWLAATRFAGLTAAIGYYGGMVAKHLDETPKCPVMLHFGEDDRGIPMSDVAAIRATVDPKLVQVFTYAGAGHAFNRAGNEAYHGPSAELARELSLAFLRERLG
jgi:carboxymethylenebutenolidase